jgi:hypothetical protein
MNIAVRGYSDGKLLFEETVALTRENVEAVMYSHVARIQKYQQHMLEIEFVDDAPSPMRFFRFGTDPGGMIIPIPYNDSKEIEWS